MSLEAKLKSDLDKAEWTYLKPHLQRDAIVLVDQDLDIIEVAKSVVKDEVEQVQKWMDDKRVHRPDKDQLDNWNSNEQKKFVFLIVQPYVLIQEMSN